MTYNIMNEQDKYLFGVLGVFLTLLLTHDSESSVLTSDHSSIHQVLELMLFEAFGKHVSYHVTTRTVNISFIDSFPN